MKRNKQRGVLPGGYGRLVKVEDGVQPGLFGTPVEYEDEFGEDKLDFIRSRDDHERALAGGVEVASVGKVRSVRPLMSKADFYSMKFGQLAPVLGHEENFMPFLKPNTPAWRRYMSTRKVVERINPVNGNTMVSVTTNMAEALEVPSRGLGDVVSKTYTLVGVLTDFDVQNKFGFTSKVLSSLRAMSIPRPDEAARQAETYMRSARPDMQVSVVAGSYSGTAKRCRASVDEFCSPYPALSAVVQSEVVGSTLVMFGLGDPTQRVSVAGPLSEAASVALVFRAVDTCGAASVNFSLGLELTVLRIDIAVGGHCPCPVVERHVGASESVLPLTSSEISTAMFSPSALSEIAGMRSRIAEVTMGGVVVGSCVRVSARFALLNTHLLTQADVLVDGVAVESVRQLSTDLWLVRGVGPGSAGWPLREAQPGERVVICYRGPRGVVQFSSPVSVLAADTQGLSLSRASDLVAGMSGGAVVSMNDLALLGVYEGVALSQAVASVFTPSMFAELHQPADASSVGTDLCAGPLARLKDRGLSTYVDAVAASIVPLYASTGLVGSGFVRSGRLYTTQNPDDVPLADSQGGTPLVFEAVEGTLWYSVTRPLTPGTGPQLVRRPNYYERVVVISRDADGPYFSAVTRVVHVGVGGKNFSLEAVEPDEYLTFQGGLVVSLQDAAVLGSVVRTTVSQSLGQVEFCAGFPPDDKPVGGFATQMEWLQRTFPALHPAVWPRGLVEEVFTHSSAQRYVESLKPFNAGMAPLAFVGDAAMRLGFGLDYRDRAIPSSQWQAALQSEQSNSVLSGLACGLGMDNVIIFGHGVVRPPLGSKVYADALEALMGAVWIAEPTGVFDNMLSLLSSRARYGADGPVDPKSPPLERVTRMTLSGSDT